MTNHDELDALHDRVVRYLRKRLRDDHLAEDIAQEVMLKLHRHRGSESIASALAWALRVARNAVIDHHRRRKPEVPLDRAAEDARAEQRSTAASELAQCIPSLLGRLPEPYRSAVELADLHREPQAAAARRLGVSVSGMKSRVQRGRRQLRAMIGECCRVELGGDGSIVGYEPTPAARGCCGTTDREDPAHSCDCAETCVH